MAEIYARLQASAFNQHHSGGAVPSSRESFPSPCPVGDPPILTAKALRLPQLVCELPFAPR